MKKAVLSALVVCLSAAAQAKSVAPSAVKISPSMVKQVVPLVDKVEPGSSEKRVQIVVEDQGLSTDVSPRYKIHFGYANLTEMQSLNVDYTVSDQAFELISATRKAPGIYVVKTREYREFNSPSQTGFYEVTQEIDATDMFADENAQKKACAEDFCDIQLKAALKVKETSAKKQ